RRSHPLRSNAVLAGGSHQQESPSQCSNAYQAFDRPELSEDWMRLSPGVLKLIHDSFSQHTPSESAVEDARVRLASVVPAEQCANLETVLTTNQLSYRDGILIQLAYAVESPGIDTTHRQEGARGIAKALGSLLASLHIRAVSDAYQNIAKNTPLLTRGNFLPFDSFLTWAKSASPEQVQACFDYAWRAVARTARPVRSMPQLDTGRLTFAAVQMVLVTLLNTPSGGAHEQYIVASLLDALIQQHDLSGRYRVETKRINASDSSSRAAGDVQVLADNRVIEAYEVTANDWRTKTQGASQKIREHDLSRIHIVAGIGATDYRGIVQELAALPDDISVLDVTAFCAAIVSTLTRNYRGAAFRRLHEYLDRYGGDVTRVNAFVALLEAQNLTVTLPVL
ncbi:MAG: hypothetical protein ACO1SX_19225, partial [Actinomycetota bacterium]